LLDHLPELSFLPRLLLSIAMMTATCYGAFRNKLCERAPNAGWFAFLLQSENFNDWGKFMRLICLVSFLATVAVLTMKMIAMLTGGPLIDLDQLNP
jgi:hypothetical protein